MTLAEQDEIALAAVGAAGEGGEVRVDGGAERGGAPAAAAQDALELVAVQQVLELRPGEYEAEAVAAQVPGRGEQRLGERDDREARCERRMRAGRVCRPGRRARGSHRRGAATRVGRGRRSQQVLPPEGGEGCERGAGPSQQERRRQLSLDAEIGAAPGVDAGVPSVEAAGTEPAPDLRAPRPPRRGAAAGRPLRTAAARARPPAEPQIGPAKWSAIRSSPAMREMLGPLASPIKARLGRRCAGVRRGLPDGVAASRGVAEARRRGRLSRPVRRGGPARRRSARRARRGGRRGAARSGRDRR